MKRQSYASILRNEKRKSNRQCIKFGNHLLNNYFQFGSYWGKKVNPAAKNQTLPSHDLSNVFTTEQAFKEYKKIDNEK